MSIKSSTPKQEVAANRVIILPPEFSYSLFDYSFMDYERFLLITVFQAVSSLDKAFIADHFSVSMTN